MTHPHDDEGNPSFWTFMVLMALVAIFLLSFVD